MMKIFILMGLIVLALLLISCEDSTGPSEVDLTPSVVSLEFTGDTLQNICEVTVSWTLCPETEFKNYVLYRSLSAGIEADSSGAEVLGIFTNQNTGEYVDSGVSWDTVYYYVVKTVDDNDDEVWSKEETLTTPESDFPTPSVLSAEVITDNVTLMWTTCLDDNFSSYKLYRSATPNIQADTISAENLFTSGVDTVFTDTGLASGNYYYALLTLNDLGLGSWSNELSVEVTDALPWVVNLELDDMSTGRNVCLTWDPIAAEVDGYAVYFREDESMGWVLVANVFSNSAVHIATCAGYYSVKAYVGELYSEEYSNSVNTMPSIVEVSFTIYDNYCSPVNPGAFIFGPAFGTTGSAPSASFIQDIYVYDDGKSRDGRGDSQVSFYSGNQGPFPNGNQTNFQTPQSGMYGCCDPDGTWHSTSYALFTSDEVVFLQLPYANGSYAYVKVCSLLIEPDPDSEHGTMVSFTYEYQPNDLGLSLFTNGN